LLLYRTNPKSKELAQLSNAVSCKTAINEAQRAFSASKWPLARDYLNEALRYAEASSRLYLQRSWCHYHSKDYYESIADAGRALKTEPDNIDALQLRGTAYFYLGEIDSALTHFRKALQLDPEHKACKDVYRRVKKVTDSDKKATQALDRKDFDAAAQHLRKVLEAAGDNAQVATLARKRLADALRRLKQFSEAKTLIQQVLERDSQDGAAHRLLGQLCMDSEDFDCAVANLKRAAEILQGDREVAEELQKAEAAQKQSKMKDWYKILGVSRRATAKEIKKAYREQALKWHPDKHKSEEEKEKAEKIFQDVAQAYEILSDDQKRAAYDRGEDVTGNNQQGGGHPGGGFPHGFNPFQHFGHGGGGQRFHFQFG
jgi:DnaJ homolog subfamily C member 3